MGKWLSEILAASWPDKIATVFMVLALVWFILAVGGCARYSDPPLPVVHDDDPVFELVPDRLDYGSLPQ